MNLKILPALALAATLAACVTPKPVTISQQFNAGDVAWSKAKGTNSLSGEAFLRQQGGGVVTCAGAVVVLVPVAPYSTERMMARYGSATSGYVDPILGPTLPAPDAGYAESFRNTRCDAQGKFTFSDLPDGNYYLATQVVWYVGNAEQGGYLMQRVSFQGGEHKQVLLTNGG